MTDNSVSCLYFCTRELRYLIEHKKMDFCKKIMFFIVCKSINPKAMIFFCCVKFIFFFVSNATKSNCPNDCLI